jgi:hypothetical protein
MFVASERGKELDLYFEFPRRFERHVTSNADPFAAAILLPSMAIGEPLEIDLPVSDLLLFNLAGIQEAFNSWYPEEFQRIRVVAPKRAVFEGPRPQAAATFFSGGVDSFYTLLKRLEHDPLPVPLTHMIFMHGVEQRLEIGEDVEASQRRAEDIAAALGIDCVVGKTNIRSAFRLHWERYYFGSALAATALALSGGMGYVCIPSSFTYRHQVPHGSTPLLDERYSTEATRIVHDGSEATRAEKTAAIVEWNEPLVLEHLRVCHHNKGGAYNCGKCYKCVRTAVALKALGAWERAALFPDKSTAHWDEVIFGDHLVLTEENLDLARRSGNPALVRRLECLVRRGRRYDALAAYAKNSALAHLLPAYRQVRKWAGGSPRMH